MTERIANTETKLTAMIANNKAEILKWMFIFWIGNVLTIVGGILGVLKIAGVF
ncbi:MAG: hypothetical protein KAW12_22630 [Candidatus Aminicenantes bacterium]|nr:hypothetical protein [Candidatus Aminicenantes bacterium]